VGGNLPQGGHRVAALLRRLDEGEDLLLAFGEFGHDYSLE